MVYRQYFIIGSSIVFVLGILLVLIFANTFRMYDEKTASKEDRILNAVDIEVNEERIFNNAETIKQIKTNDIEIEDDISYMAKNITSMDDKINTNESSIDSIHDVLDGLKNTDKKLKAKDDKMQAEWIKQFNDLLITQKENNQEVLEHVDDRFLFADVSEETSWRISELETTIDEAEEHLDYLKRELDKIHLTN